MRPFNRLGLFLAVCLLAGPVAKGSVLLPITNARHIEISDAVFRGEVLSLNSYQNTNDGHIYTTAAVRVDEVFKGRLPAVVKLVHAGGTVGDRGEMNDFVPQLKAGEERLFFISRSGDGTLSATRGDASALHLSGATPGSQRPFFSAGEILLNELRKQTTAGAIVGSDVTDQTASAAEATPTPANRIFPFGPPPGSPVPLATNLLVDGSGIPARFVLPDRGEPIPYLIDADYLPTGITTAQAITAVQTALAAWTAVSSVKYTFLGVQSFGMAAQNISTDDGILRIQLHDHYGSISGSSSSGDTLGVGGHYWTSHTLTPGWTSGGNVNGSDFHKSINGFIELSYTNVAMQTLSLFTEVLCHEVGHTIGLAHSSNNQNESNPLLNQAIMYFLAHGGGRGATLGAYDPPVVRQIHPTNNIPPYIYDRLIDVVTGPVEPITTPGANMVQLRGYSLHPTNLTLATTDATSINGSFSVVNSNITFLPSGYFSDSSRIDPSTTAYYDIIYARYSDGINASPYATVRVAALYADSSSEGVPDSWRTTYFGNPDPTVGAKHHATDDADGDGYNNLEEFKLGSNPTDKTSNLRITSFATTNIQWQAKAYEVYEIYGTTNLANPNWVRVTNPIVPTTSTGMAFAFTNGGPKQFFRVSKVP